MLCTEEWWISNGWIELQIKKIRERRTLWKNLRKRRIQTMGHTHTETLLRGWYLEGVEETGKAQIRIFRTNIIIRDMGCETFREVKQLTWDRVEWCQTSLRTVLNDDDVKKKCFYTCVPIFPSRLQTYRPRNPVLPKTVATIPLKLLRPPVPRFKLDAEGFRMIRASVLYDAVCK